MTQAFPKLSFDAKWGIKLDKIFLKIYFMYGVYVRRDSRRVCNTAMLRKVNVCVVYSRRRRRRRHHHGLSSWPVPVTRIETVPPTIS
jgi:hypothetical protein